MARLPLGCLIFLPCPGLEVSGMQVLVYPQTIIGSNTPVSTQTPEHHPSIRLKKLCSDFEYLCVGSDLPVKPVPRNSRNQGIPKRAG